MTEMGVERAAVSAVTTRREMTMAANLYFTILANSTTEAEAMAEAMKVARAIDSLDPVSVKVCDTQRLVARVFANGNVHVLRDNSNTDTAAE